MARSKNFPNNNVIPIKSLTSSYPPTETPEENNKDYRIIKQIYQLGHILAIAPTCVTNQNAHFKLFWSIYTVGLFLCYSTAILFSIHERILMIGTYSISQSILDCSEKIAEYIFIEFDFIMAIVKRQHWISFWASLSKLDKKFDTLDGFSRCLVDKQTTYMVIVVGHASFCFMHLFSLFVYMTNNAAHMLFRLVTYYQLYTLLFLVYTGKWLKTRYNYLDKLLCISVIRRKKFFVTYKFQGEELAQTLQEIVTIYKKMYYLIEEVNVIFGWKIFTILVCLLLSMLNSLNFALTTSGDELTVKHILANIFYTSNFITCAVTIVMACDGVEKSGEKISKSCYLLLENLNNAELKEELVFLGTYTKELAPKFCAAGFWQVNQSLLSTLFSAITTYLIIIIQFNMSLSSTTTTTTTNANSGVTYVQITNMTLTTIPN